MIGKPSQMSFKVGDIIKPDKTRSKFWSSSPEQYSRRFEVERVGLNEDIDVIELTGNKSRYANVSMYVFKCVSKLEQILK